MNIGVFGLGYVGIVNVACLSKQGHKVWCTDVKSSKTDLVAEGKSPIHEPEVDQLLAQGIEKGLIIPTTDVQEVLLNADVYIICVGTPSKADGEVNLTYLNNVVFEISNHVNSSSKKYLVFRSTVPPGTTEKLVEQYISGKHENIIPVFYPEFLREGSAVKDFFNYGRLVLGCNNEADITELIALLHVNTESQKFITNFKTAEYSKYIDNGFHALKVSFANEVFGVAAAHGVNVDIAHKIFVADDKLNISPQYLKPGLPFGGSCLPKDLRELQYLMGKSGRNFALLNSIIPSNEKFIDYIKQRITNLGISRLAFIGITFKNHSDDLRESPMLRIFNELDATGNFDILLADDDINLSTVRIEHPALFSKIVNIAEAVDKAELLIVSKRYLKDIMGLKKPSQTILNLADLTPSNPEMKLIGIYS